MKKNKIKAEERDLLSQKSEVLNRVALFRYNEALRDVMEKEVYLCRADDTITSVAKVMAQQRISSAIVTDVEHMPVGIPIRLFLKL
jgi:predicted transcriptional regulator